MSNSYMHVVYLHLFCLVLRILCVMLLTATDEGCMLNSHIVTAQIFHRRESPVTLHIGDYISFFLRRRNVVVFSILYYHLGLMN